MKAPLHRFPAPRVLVAAAFGATLLGASAFAQVINPDPDVFDGTKTKRQGAIQQEGGSSKTDDWEGDNLIVYDSKEEGSETGGLGRSGGKQGGMDIGVEGGMQSSMGGIPIPLGGGAGGGQSSSTPMPTLPMGGGAAGAESSQNAGMIPPDMSGAAGAAGGESGEAGQAGQGGEGGQGGDQSAEGLSAKDAVKPGDVSIGDNNQKIKGSTVAGNGDANQAPSEQGGKGSQATQDGGQSANVGGAGGGSQSGKRGTGVEKGDAMPSDM